MKRIVILFVLLCAGYSLATAQDLITTTDGKDVQAKVLEVGTTTVKYVKYSNPDGPVYIIPLSEILMIRYANGDKDVFYEEAMPSSYPSTQVYEGMRYKQYKRFYNKHDYVRRDDDPYSPFLAGFGSFYVPGLGQLFCGEWGRGAAFCLGTYLTLGMATVSAATAGTYSYDNQGYRDSYHSGYSSIPLFLAAGTLWIWNICDAVKIAKIKNMYYQDVYGRKSEIKLHIEPYVGCSPVAATPNANLASGLSLRVDF